MSNSLTVKEQIHPIWKTGTLISLALCGLFFALFWINTDPFWIGIFRLCTFAFFALTVLGGLKIINGPLEATLDYNEKLLLVSYQKKGKTVQEEQFDRHTIKKIGEENPQSELLQSYLQSDSLAFKINFTDTDRELYLFEFGGRPLLFDSQTRINIKNFLRDLNITV